MHRHDFLPALGPFARLALAIVALAPFAATRVASAADPVAPWHLSGWKCRAVVKINERSQHADIDAAVVRVLCQGRARPAGEDYRVVDAAGKPIPFQLLYHDAARYSLIALKCDDPAATCYVYYGNPDAPAAAEMSRHAIIPGAGPPGAGDGDAGKWFPRCGLLLTTFARPEGENPKTIEEFTKMLAASPASHGARLQPRISDGFNPFGSSDFFLSVYRGWIEIPADGEYKFCTASNEASFSFLDGKELIHWPGRHTAERGARGEKNAAVTLTKGRHFVEYYHEEVTLDQMAFLGWSPPGTPMGAFSGIAESAFPMPHAAEVASYEQPSAPLVVFEPTLVDSAWPEARGEGQYTRVSLKLVAPEGIDPATLQWSFGDGLSATGPVGEHLYLTLGQFEISLKAGEETIRWPLDVFEVQHVTEAVRGGNLTEYAKLAAAYDREKLSPVAASELAFLLAEVGELDAAIAAARFVLERHAAALPERLPKMHRLIADASLRKGGDGIDQAVAAFMASLNDKTPPAERFDLLGRVIYLLGVERNQPDKAAEIVTQLEEAARGARLDDESRAAYRRALIAAGDAPLWQGNLTDARTKYRQAEAQNKPKIPESVRSARVGAYPNAVRDLISRDDHPAALDLVRQWEETFPTEKLTGQTFFWRGKLLFLESRNQEAARFLARAVGLGQGAAFESEARWLLALALEKLNRADESRVELAKLVKSGAADEFAKKAAERLKQKP